MRRPTALFAFALAGLVTAGGCTVKAPSTGFGSMTDVDAGNGDPQQPPQDNPDMAHAATLTTPQLDTYDQRSVYTTVPLRGTTSPPNSAVIITAMDGTQTSADVDSGGRFCANLVLQPNKANIFQLKTHDPATGLESETISVQVQQSGEPSQAQQPAQSYNASAGGAATAYQIGTDGTAPAQQVTDGDNGTWIEGDYQQDWHLAFPEPAVTVELSSPVSIDKIVATLAADCVGDGTITLAYSAQSAPTQPGPNAQGWVTTNATKSSDGRTWSATFNGASARYVAVWWNGLSWSSSTDKGGCGSLGSTFGVAELQAWTTPGGTAPPQSPPMCGE